MGEQARPEGTIGLAELIVAVRDELEKADAARLDRADDSLLELREVELELQFEVRRARSAQGGLDLRVLSAGSPGAAPVPPPQAQRLRVLYGPAFKVVDIEGATLDAVPDWLRPPVAGSGLRADPPPRLDIDDEVDDGAADEVDDDLGGLADLRESD